MVAASRRDRNLKPQTDDSPVRLLYAYYDRDADIAMISFENGRANSERYDWGLIDRHPDDGHLMGFEIWEASKMLPAEMIAALPLAGKPAVSAA